MVDDFKNDDNVLEVVERFEQMLENDEQHFFDVQVYEMVIAYYRQENKIKQALPSLQYSQPSIPFFDGIIT